MKARNYIAALAAASMLLLSGCGGTSGSSESEQQTSESPASTALAKTQTVNVGVLGSTADIPLLLGQKEGIFAKHGLDIELTRFNGGSEMVPAALQGSIQFGNGNFLSVMTGVEKGLAIKIVAATDSTPPDPGGDISSIVVAKDSPITDIKELAGKTVAINALKSISEVAVRSSLQAAGVDPDNVKLVEFPFPQIAQAVSQGNADAGFLISPLTEVFSDQVTSIYHPFSELFSGEPIGGYFTTDQLIKDDPELVKNFVAAFKEAGEYANEHPEEGRALLPDYLKLPAEVTDVVPVPEFDPELNPMPKITKDAKRDGILTQDPDYDVLYWKG